MAKIKGTALKPTVAYVKERLGERGFEEILSTFPPEEAAILHRPILPSFWYELSLVIRLMKSAQQRLPAAPGRSFANEMGRHSEESGFYGIHKLFFKAANPGYIVKMATKVFPTYYDCGEMRLLVSEPKRAVVRLVGFDQPSEIVCDRVMGWMERALELSGAVKMNFEHPSCAARGDAYCEYVATWE